MSITFDRVQLIKVAESALDEHAKAKVKFQAACDKYRASHAANRTQPTRDRARQLRDALTKALKAPGPVTAQMVKRATDGTSYTSDLFYIPPNDRTVEQNVNMPPGLLKPAELVETRALVTVLKAATGDTISVNELKLLGLKNLEPVFTAAANKAGA